MRIVDIRAQTVPISRYADPNIPSGGLDTTAVAIVTDVLRDGLPVVGYGFSSMGRFGQAGLIRERFAPRLLEAQESELTTDSGDNLDPFRTWNAMMKGEKPGGHGERCVAVGTLDMALWDAAAKIADQPLYRFLGDHIGREVSGAAVMVYAGGGYPFPSDDIARLQEEIRGFLDEGYTHVKVKIGAQALENDLKRIEAALSLLPNGDHLAVDAMNAYTPETALRVAKALEPYGLRWFEDVCDPLDFEAHARIARAYARPIAAGEALFSLADARNLIRYGGLRPEQDVLVFDPVHCYGLPEYLKIVSMLEHHGWARSALQPHGGHLFCLHVVAALGLGGGESNPHTFWPFGGFCDGVAAERGRIAPPDVPGIGFETRASLYGCLRSWLETM
jgi:L-alanine-DL-glutamate epimerase-like enolase superfamily enzyme